MVWKMKDEKKSRIKITNEMSSQGWALPVDDQSATLLGPEPFKTNHAWQVEGLEEIFCL